MVFHASQTHMDIMYIWNLIKIPTTIYVNATLKIWGHDFLRIRGGDIQTFGPMGKTQMSKGEPIKLSTTFLVLLTQSFITARNWLGLVIAWDGQGMTSQTRIGEAISCWETHFDSLGKQKNPKT